MTIQQTSVINLLKSELIGKSMRVATLCKAGVFDRQYYIVGLNPWRPDSKIQERIITDVRGNSEWQSRTFGLGNPYGMLIILDETYIYHVKSLHEKLELI